MYCLLIITLLAVFHDLKSYKIKNYIIIIGITTGLSFNFIEVGFQGMYYYLFAIILPVIVLFPLFLIKGLGAGDIKLFSVVGSFLGISHCFKVIIFSFLVGGFLSLIYLIKTKGFSKRFNYLISYVSRMKGKNQDLISGGKVTIKEVKLSPYYDKDIHGREGVIHFSLAILFGLIIFLFIKI